MINDKAGRYVSALIRCTSGRL